MSWYRRVVGRIGATALVAVILGLGACGGTTAVPPNEFGECVFEPGATCTEQDFTAVDLSDLDLTGGDFAGSKFTDADLRGAVLRNADLRGADFTKADLSGADLFGADLTDAVVFSATLEGADWDGATRAGLRTCETVLPDGSISDCPNIDRFEVPENTEPPPAITRFDPVEAGGCLRDARGEGIEVEWQIVNGQSVVFRVDDVPAGGDTGRRGVTRIPFPCDGRTHTVAMEAFGQTLPPALDSFALSVPGR